MLSVLTNSEAESLAWARDFGRQLQVGDVVALYGDLGAGKTVISRGICSAWGFEGGVHSPSYALVHEYPNDPPLYHLDLYRLEPPADLHEIGVEHYAFAQGITLIEWPERLEENNDWLTWEVRVEHRGENQRQIYAQKLANLE
ncbi:MAG: tRNA (adenosine(37)-N6)-threonylcarbamoyltransferase complex ATPase subunit type 1 TsaE [Fibrobacter sp.]|nr:tRNA (adenosine(37)-N6)-threonylcarbamoyltransferase complex ATPase subunit type 1 TsaE [Fibrobacter sp.]